MRGPRLLPKTVSLLVLLTLAAGVLLGGAGQGRAAGTFPANVPPPLAAAPMALPDGSPTVGVQAPAVPFPELGLQVQELAGEALLVSEVAPGSAAAAAGLRPGDLLLRAGTRRTQDGASLASAIATTPAGSSLELTLVRSAQLLRAELRRPSAAPEGLPAAADPIGGRASARAIPAPPLAVISPAQLPEIGVEVAASGTGAKVHRVYPGSHGERGGLKAGDTILAVAGKSTPDLLTFTTRLKQAPLEQNLEFTVVRNGQLHRLQVMVGEGELEGVTLPADAAPPYTQAARAAGAGKPAAASTPAALNQSGAPAAERLGLTLRDEPWGVTVQSVRPGSSAARSGLRAGDLILQVGRAPLPDVASLERWIGQAGAGGELRVKLLRHGRSCWKALPL